MSDTNINAKLTQEIMRPTSEGEDPVVVYQAGQFSGELGILSGRRSAIAGSISCRSRIEGPQLRALEIQKVSRKRGFIGNGIAALDDDRGGSRFAIRRKSLMFRDEELVDLRRFDKIGCCVQARRIGDGEREAGMA